MFGKPVAAFQNTKFELAACKADVDAARGGCRPRAARRTTTAS